jgi:zinc and cadmium transporter
MANVWLYSIGSVFLVSLIAFVGILTLSLKKETLKKIVLYLVSFSAGALFGGAFIHLLPEAAEEFGFGPTMSISLLGGILIFFILEKFIHWRHCHIPTSKEHPHPFAYMNLVGDGVHNFIDGLVIGGAYLLSIPVGIATTVAVVLHEIPQEIGDFGVLIHGGFEVKKALLMNFLTALTAVVGVITALIISGYIENIAMYLIPFTAGGFIYIAGSDLIPELHKEVKPKKSAIQLVFLLLGIGIMLGLMLMHHG